MTARLCRRERKIESECKRRLRQGNRARQGQWCLRRSELGRCGKWTGNAVIRTGARWCSPSIEQMINAGPVGPVGPGIQPTGRTARRNIDPSASVAASVRNKRIKANSRPACGV
jgi:hypothetical protein